MSAQPSVGTVSDPDVSLTCSFAALADGDHFRYGGVPHSKRDDRTAYVLVNSSGEPLVETIRRGVNIARFQGHWIVTRV